MVAFKEDHKKRTKKPKVVEVKKKKKEDRMLGVEKVAKPKKVLPKRTYVFTKEKVTVEAYSLKQAYNIKEEQLKQRG